MSSPLLFLLLLSLSLSQSSLAQSSYLNGRCSPSSCLNGGVCRSFLSSSLYWCSCSEGYYGKRCEFEKCEPSCENGRCTVDKGEMACKCFPGYGGEACDVVLPSTCTRKRPCGEHGRCRLLEIKDQSTGRDYECDCEEGWSGVDCRLREDSCDGIRLCQNGGRCVVQEGDMVCKCPEGFEGLHCERPFDYCRWERPCENGGECTNTKFGGYHCSCPRGFAGHRCELALSSSAQCSPDHRSPLTCTNGGYCSTSGKCECPSGWSGLLCEEDVRECEHSPCRNGGFCNEEIGGFSCVCPMGFQGTMCEVDVNECALGHECAVGSECVDGAGGYTCRCPEGKTGRFCTETEECHGRSCDHGVCYESEKGASCLCDEGWTGANCDEDVDECADKPCAPGVSCLNTQGSFKCMCPSSKTGRFCEIDVFTCADDSECSNGGRCINGLCTCKTGFEGYRCDIRTADICTASSCARGQVCTVDRDSVRGFTCSCPEGFTGEHCDYALSPSCSANPCEHGASCANISTGAKRFHCNCPAGYSGERCEIVVDHCAVSPCSNGGRCVNEAESFLCICDPAHYGTRCEKTRDPCAGNLCDNGALCKPTMDFRNYTCECPRGFSGEHCEQDLDECERRPCLNGATCVNNHGGYACICSLGYEGRHCAKNTDDCARGPCLNNGTCIDGLAEYTCQCQPGFTGKMCAVNIDDCAENPCQNGGICRDGANRYTCDCRKGFSGRDCERNDDDCRPGLCLNGGYCIDGIADYRCACQRGFYGRNCERWEDVDRFNTTDDRDRSSCRQHNCDKLSLDEVCHPQCNHYACNFDGGACSARTQPFSRCPSASYCAHVFNDGKCDEICNNENCLFDGFDCDRSEWHTCPITRRSYCREHAGDGVCDEMCDSEECGWDGGDCGHKENKTMLSEVVVILLVEPRVFIEKVNEFLSSLSTRLRAGVRVKKTEGGWEVFEWTAKGGEGTRVAFERTKALASSYSVAPRAKRSVDINGVLVVLEIDLADCSKECFSDAQAIAFFLGAAQANEAFAQLGMPIYQAIQAKPNDRKGSGYLSGYVWFVVVVVFGSFGVVTAYKLAPKRKTVEAPLWVPPKKNFYSSSNELYLGVPPVFKHSLPPSPQPEANDLELAAAGKDRIPKELLSFVHVQGRFGRHAIHWLSLNSVKSSSDIIDDLELLHSAGADLDALDEDEDSALHMACRNCRPAVVRRLIELGANPIVANKMEMTPLHEAAKAADHVTISELLKAEGVKNCSFLDAVDSEDRTALMLYAANSTHSTKGAEALIEAGADVNYAGDKKRSDRYKGWTALHHCAAWNFENKDMIDFLIAKNANKDATNAEEATALWLAVNSRNTVAVDALLTAGAGLDFADQKDRSPEYLASEKNYTDILQKLIEARKNSPSSLLGRSIEPFIPFPPRQSTIPVKVPVAKSSVKRPLIKKSKSPATPATTSSAYSTTPSPPGLKATTLQGGTTVSSSCMDSPNSDHHGRHSTGAANSSGGHDVFTSPHYANNYAMLPSWDRQPLQPGMRPSPPYETFHSEFPPPHPPPEGMQFEIYSSTMDNYTPQGHPQYYQQQHNGYNV